jgi:hypothetical protein
VIVNSLTWGWCELARVLSTVRVRRMLSGRRRYCSTTTIERTFWETRRRVKVIGRLPGERSWLSLVWGGAGPGQPWLAWVVMTPAAGRLLQELHRQLHHPSGPEEVVDQTVTPAA